MRGCLIEIASPRQRNRWVALDREGETMKSILLAIILLICSGVAYGQTSNPSTAAANDFEQQLRQMERLKDEAYVKGDIDALNRIYADDYIAINAGGATSNKNDLIKFNTGFGQVIYESHTSSEISVRLFGDVAVITGTYNFKYKKPARGNDSDQYRYTSIYALRSGHWQVVADQFTRIKK